MEMYHFSGWATKNNLRCSDGRTIMRDAFVGNDGKTVPLVWNHQHNEPTNVLGHALLENRPEGVYAYCTFNDTESGKAAKELVEHGDVSALSIYANQLKQQGGNVLHGAIREVSLVLAGANPGAYIDSIMKHGEDSDEEAIIFTGEDITLAHADNAEKKEKEPEKKESKEEPKEEKKAETESTKEEKNYMAENKEKTVKDVFDTFTEEQKTVVYALIGQALEDAGVGDEDENVEHSDGGNEEMYHNVFENDEMNNVNVLSHADQDEILSMARTVGSFKKGLEMWGNDHLKHGFGAEDGEPIDMLFTEVKNVPAGAPTLLERDMDWVAHVMAKANKSPIARVRTRQIDARAAEITAKAHKKGEAKKAAANMKLLKRETHPQTVYIKDALHRDDITDMDFDGVAYMRNVMKRTLEETVALAALVGDFRNEEGDKISDQNIRPIWTDDELYTIRVAVDIAAAKKELQGSNTSANFGDNYIYAEAIIAAALHAREKYKGKGTLDFYCTPHLLNVMLLARDLNGRRIYESKSDLAKVLNVANIFTVEQFADLDARKDENDNEFKLLGIFVNMNNYQFGCAKGGEITSFEDFDIDYNQYKYLMETRLSGALIDPYSAIVIEEPVVEAAG